MTKANLTAQPGVVEQLKQFVQYGGKKFLGINVQTGQLVASDSMTSIAKLGESFNVIKDNQIKDHFETDTQYHALKVVQSNDPWVVSTENGIPLSRLVFDYETIFDLNQQYLDKLDAIHAELVDVFNFLIDHGLISVSSNQTSTLADMIRLFIQKELTSNESN